MKAALRRPLAAVLGVCNSIAAPCYARVARTGVGWNTCLRHGFLPLPLHYYQPIFDPDRLPEAVWTRRHELPGIDFDPAGQLAFLRELHPFSGECDWPEHPVPGRGTHYYSTNDSFGYSSACLLHSIVRLTRPRKVIEVGGGMSTLLLLDAMAANDRAGADDSTLLTIDPHPSPLFADLDHDRHTLAVAPVETLSPLEFESLGEGDLLFVDSSHVVRTGGDVNFLYLDVLPRLARGVVVHIHDVQLPYEYPDTFTRRSIGAWHFWTEQYLLQAFLALNPHYRILLGGHFIQRDHPSEFSAAFPGWRPDKHPVTGSFYVARL